MTVPSVDVVLVVVSVVPVTAFVDSLVEVVLELEGLVAVVVVVLVCANATGANAANASAITLFFIVFLQLMLRLMEAVVSRVPVGQRWILTRIKGSTAFLALLFKSTEAIARPSVIWLSPKRRSRRKKAPAGSLQRGLRSLANVQRDYLPQQPMWAMQQAPPLQQSDIEVAVAEPTNATAAMIINRYFIDSPLEFPRPSSAMLRTSRWIKPSRFEAVEREAVERAALRLEKKRRKTPRLTQAG
ncbi:MAG: hypothetical protein H0X73_07455 [Chthoniobacterales bacterium]|nr:hypothetical protein [Chthoniobacterales bacterium]